MRGEQQNDAEDAGNVRVEWKIVEAGIARATNVLEFSQNSLA